MEGAGPDASGGAGEGEDFNSRRRFVTIPNVLTFARLMSIPFFVWLLVIEERRVAAAWYLAIMATTDWFDGWIARRFNQGTPFGKLFDPTVDRILFVVALVSIIAVDGIPLWFAVLTLVREVGVGLVTLVLFALRYEPVSVVYIGKVGTFALLTAIPLFLASTDPSFPQWAEAAAWVVGVPGLVAAYASIAMYVPSWRAAVRKGKVARVQPA